MKKITKALRPKKVKADVIAVAVVCQDDAGLKVIRGVDIRTKSFSRTKAETKAQLYAQCLYPYAQMETVTSFRSGLRYIGSIHISYDLDDGSFRRFKEVEANCRQLRK